jgi:nucleotide-binding universal stress UspA family protein
MIRSILVPLDGSAFGEHALPMALSIARRAGATLHVVHVHEMIPPATVAGVAVMDAIDLHLRQDEQVYLADVARRIADGRPVALTTALLEGEVVPAIKQYAAKNGIDLIVLSTHGRGAIGRFWLGSVADELVGETDQPVLLIRPGEGKADLKTEVDLKTILIPSDGTLRSEEVLGPTLDLARLFHSNLDVVRVIKPVLRPGYMAEGATFTGLSHALDEVGTLQAAQRERAQVYLDEVANELAEEGFPVQTQVVIDEEPAAGIEQEAQARHADLIAMETHARRGLARLFRGSVADKVVRDGVAPVLLHHRPR